MKRSILVTGASGFIGKALVAGLAEQGWQVRAASRNPASIIAPSGVERLAMPDLGVSADWSPLLTGVRQVVHAAGIAHARGRIDDNIYDRVNATAVGELAEAARRHMVRLVFISSARAQAGFSSEQPITESDRPSPIDAYGRSKLMAEELIKKNGVSFTILRPTIVYGKGVKGNIARLAKLARMPLPLPLGGLHNLRSLLALENLTSAVHFALTSEHAENQFFLVADAEPISVAVMIAAMREGLGRPPHLMQTPVGGLGWLMAAFGKEAAWQRLSGTLIVDARKLRDIGWCPYVKTREGLSRMMHESSLAD